MYVSWLVVIRNWGRNTPNDDECECTVMPKHLSIEPFFLGGGLICHDIGVMLVLVKALTSWNLEFIL